MGRHSCAELTADVGSTITAPGYRPRISLSSAIDSAAASGLAYAALMAESIIRRVARQRQFSDTLRDAAQGLRRLSKSAETSRSTLLAVSELMRRRGGDRPQIPDESPLTGFELRALSQNGEDGVVIELLRRAGDGGRIFVEFGAGAGEENNCALLADVMGWSGLFIEADPTRARRLTAKYASTAAVKTRREYVTPDSVEELLSTADVPVDFDVLSVDVDGADYWIWRGLRRFRPRIVIIEYNASLGAEQSLVQPPDRSDDFDRTQYGGASIAALRDLGNAKGYRLVHTELTGNNAFFVRVDQPGTYPAETSVPLRSPNHYLQSQGHPPDRGDRRYVSHPTP